MRLRGIPVRLLVKTPAGVDGQGRRVWEWDGVEVQNVLIAPLGEASDSAALPPDAGGDAYRLAIPKTDTHRWEGQLVQFWDCTWVVLGTPTKGIDFLVPGPWNKKVVVALYRSATPTAASLFADALLLYSGASEQDPDGYRRKQPATPRSVTGLFTAGVDEAAYSDGDKTGGRKAATVELWDGDYEGETHVKHDGTLYVVSKRKTTGRGTVQLTLEEEWR